MRAICRWQCDGMGRHNKVLNADLAIQTGLAHFAGLGSSGCVITAIVIHSRHILLVCAHRHPLLLHWTGRCRHIHASHSLKRESEAQQRQQEKAELAHGEILDQFVWRGDLAGIVIRLSRSC